MGFRETFAQQKEDFYRIFDIPQSGGKTMFELNSENSFNRIAFHHRHHFYYDDGIANSSHALRIFSVYSPFYL